MVSRILIALLIVWSQGVWLGAAGLAQRSPEAAPSPAACCPLCTLAGSMDCVCGCADAYPSDGVPESPQDDPLRARPDDTRSTIRTEERALCVGARACETVRRPDTRTARAPAGVHRFLARIGVWRN